MRLLSNDPTASSELAHGVLDPLLNRLGKKFPDLRESDLLYDAVTDALMEYIKNPSKFDPSKRGLFGYLFMAAKGDLLNALSKKERHRKKEIITADVEFQELAGNSGLDTLDLETQIDKGINKMRISVKPDDPGYSPLAKDGYVFLDGRKLDMCFTADEELGMVWVYKKKDKGLCYLDEEGELAVECLKGHVQIVLPNKKQ